MPSSVIVITHHQQHNFYPRSHVILCAAVLTVEAVKVVIAVGSHSSAAASASVLALLLLLLLLWLSAVGERDGLWS